MSDKIIRKSIPKWFVNAVEPKKDFTLLLTFHDGSKKIFDFKPILNTPVFYKLNSVGFFMKAHLEGHSVVWDEDMDIASEYLYENSVAV